MHAAKHPEHAAATATSSHNKAAKWPTKAVQAVQHLPAEVSLACSIKLQSAQEHGIADHEAFSAAGVLLAEVFPQLLPASLPRYA